MPSWSKLSGTVNQADRMKWGIAPKGKGPHKAEDYALPMPSASHPRARAFARAIVHQARYTVASGAYSTTDVVKQVRKANSVLYGVPNPTAAQKRAARNSRRTAKSGTLPTGETNRETYMDVPAPDGSVDQINGLILDAARACDLFGGPAIPWGTLGYNDDVCRPYDISITWLFPMTSEVVIQNSNTAEMWRVTFSIDEDDVVTFGDPQPAELDIVTAGQEVLKKARESGVRAPKFVPIREGGRISREALTREASSTATQGVLSTDGIDVQLISAGPGNSADKNYYAPEFITQVINDGKFEGAQCYYDHPSKFDEQNQPERSVQRLAGWFSNPRLGTHTTAALGTQSSAVATFNAPKGESLASSLLATAREYAQAYPDGEYVGFSIYSYGLADGTRTFNGEEWTNVVAMTECISVDLVTHAGARGGPIFNNPAITDSQESNMPNRSLRSASGKSGREAAAPKTFLDDDLDIDISTPEERIAKNKETAAAQREHMRANQPVVFAAAVTAAGLQAVANAEALKGLTDEQSTALDRCLGIAEGTPVGDAVKGKPFVETKADAAEDIEESDESESKEGDSDDELSDGAIKAMSDSEKIAMIKKLSKKVSKAEKKADESESLATENASLRASIESRNRAALTERLANEFKIPATHREMFSRVLSTAKDPDDAVAAARAYVTANVPTTAPGFNPGVTRESRATSTTKMTFLAK